MAKAQPNSDSDFSDEETSPLDVNFNEAAKHLGKISDKLTTEQLLELYGLYKQGSIGKCNISKPGFFDTKGRKKWEAWESLGNMPQTTAKSKYIEMIQKYDPSWKVQNKEKPAITPKKDDKIPTTSMEETRALSGEKIPSTSKDTLRTIDKKPSKEGWANVSSLQRSASPEEDDSVHPLISAAKNFDGSRCAELLKKNPELANDRDDDGMTALHWAADRNATNALRACIEGGCNINAVDNSGQTALHYAASCGHKESTRILVEAGAGIYKDKYGCTPSEVTSDEEIKNILSALSNCICKRK